MKKAFILALFLTIAASQVFAASKSKISIHDGSKPNFILITAQWAPGFGTHLDNFNAMNVKYGNDAVFKVIDISDPKNSAAAEYNKINFIYPNVPYVVMLRGGGQIARYVQNDCSANLSCLESKMKAFLKK